MALTTYKTGVSTDRAALYRIIKGMREAGWVPKSYSDGEESHKFAGILSENEIADKLLETEQAWLYWRKGELKGTMMFVFGNEPHEVMADCSMDGGVWDADLAAVEEAINLEGV